MKNILNLFLAVLMVAFSTISSAQSRNPASGSDPNMKMSDLPEAGTMMQGTDFAKQKDVCVKCQQRDLLLSETKDIYVPGSAPTKGSSSPTGSGTGHK